MDRFWPRNPRLYLGASLLLALAAALVAHSTLARYRAEAALARPQVSLVIAATHIGRGSQIRAEDVELRSVPAGFAPPGAAEKVEDVVGRVLLADLAPREVVTETRLARVRAGPVASLVPRGLRAFAVPSSLPATAVAPGDRIDVLATFAGGQPHTEIVVAGVEVLLVLSPTGAPLQGEIGGGEAADDLALDVGGAGLRVPALLVVLVSPQQQERLAFARAFANLEVTVAPSAEPG